MAVMVGLGLVGVAVQPGVRVAVGVGAGVLADVSVGCRFGLTAVQAEIRNTSSRNASHLFIL